ncbi:MAG TPA: O-antigen ligase family protein, partial [Actinomycetota bacterium]|nr:O-antigen ligase family protein [Actinomycetota bacterium]
MAALVAAAGVNRLSAAGFGLAVTGLALAIVVAVAPVVGVILVSLLRAPTEALNGINVLEIGLVSFDAPGVMNLAFLIGGAIWLIRQLRAGVRFWTMPMFWPMAVLTAMATISVVYSADLFFSLRDVFKLSAVLAAYVLLVAARPAFAQIRLILVATVVSSLYPVALGWWQFANSIGVNFEKQAGLRIQSVFEHPNTFALYLVAVLVALFGLRSETDRPLRHLIDAWSLISFVTLMLPMGRTAWMAAGLIILVVGWRHRGLFLAAAAAGLTAILVMPRTLERLLDLFASSEPGTADSVSIRLDVWTQGLTLWQRKPLTGFGWGTFAGLTDALAHNDYIRAAVELGIVGFIAFVALMIALLRAGYRAAKGRDDLPLAFFGFAIAFVIGSA